MSFVHGKGAVVTLNSVDLSAYTNNVEFGRALDSHDVTTFGQTAHKYQGGLMDGTCTLEGIYESVSVTGGPPAIIPALITAGNTVTLVWKPEGTGSGKPIRTVTVLPTSYDETAPVADMITWSCELQLSGAIADTTG